MIPLKVQVVKEDGRVEHKLGGSATCVIPTHAKGGISNLVRLLVMRGKFEELSLCEAHMVELTFFGPAYEGVYMDGGIRDSALFKLVDTLGEAIDTLLPHDTLLEYGAIQFSRNEVYIINVLHDDWYLLGVNKFQLSLGTWQAETKKISGTTADWRRWRGLYHLSFVEGWLLMHSHHPLSLEALIASLGVRFLVK